MLDICKSPAKLVEELENVLLSHCHDMEILREDAEEKKKEAILDSLIVAVLRANLTTQDLKNCISDINDDKVLDVTFFEHGGNVMNYIKPKWRTFAMTLLKKRSVGLGTPNAASGEGELMFLFLSKKITKPTSGDLKIGDEIIELKGEGARASGEISGIEFRKKTIKICKKFKLVPNKAFRNALLAVELEHWKKELSKLPLARQKEFVGEWLRCLDDETHDDSIKIIFHDGSFNHELFVKEIVKILFASMVENNCFNKFVILGDGKNAKIINGTEDFNKKINEGTIMPLSDYFRINQGFNVGWYIE